MSLIVERLEPGAIVELNDLLLNDRKLGVVDETGVGYFDILGSGELPKPLLSALQPQSLGTIASWFKGHEDSEMAAVWDQLTSKNLDVLTIARALHWGFANKSTDHDLLEKMGVLATQKIVDGRKAVEKTQ